MQGYQTEYIENCRLIRELTASPYIGSEVRRSKADVVELTRRNTVLIRDNLLLELSDIYSADADSLAELETFAGELTKGPLSLDVPLACQIHSALLTRYRRDGRREDVIRELYNLGMARYGLWYMVSGLQLGGNSGLTLRMRYCFVEAASYIRYFDEFDADTQSYILRSTANTYLGTFDDWHDKLEVVRHSMRVFTDERYRAAAPDLPWDRYISLLHQQMIGTVPHTFSQGELTPDAVADVMESAHTVYAQYFKPGNEISQQNLFSYYSLEFRCGLMSKEDFLRITEEMLDDADPTSYDVSNAYKIISLPAFYSQYLNLMPEMLPPREDYVKSLYRRMFDYIEKMPIEHVNDRVLLYVRQALSVFLELDGGMTYREFAMAIMRRISPDTYRHGRDVGQLARELCRTIVDNDPRFFEEIPELEGLEGDTLRDSLSELALSGGILHDLGKLNFSSLYDHCGRQMLSIEDELLQLHTLAGYNYMSSHGSTLAAADAATGHHRYYDGSGGYPSNYDRKSSPYRSLVDVIGLCDFLASPDGDDSEDVYVSAMTFDERIAAALAGEGRRFSPLVTAWLRTPELLERLRAVIEPK